MFISLLLGACIPLIWFALTHYGSRPPIMDRIAEVERRLGAFPMYRDGKLHALNFSEVRNADIDQKLVNLSDYPGVEEMCFSLSDTHSNLNSRDRDSPSRCRTMHKQC